MTTNRSISLGTIAAALLIASAANGQEWKCARLDESKPAELVEYLKDDRHALPAACVQFAIESLGRHKYQAAIPVLISYLDYPRQPADTTYHDHAQTLAYLFPAANALEDIGRPSIPALLRVIADADTLELVRTRAGNIILEICIPKHQPDAIALMVQASRQETDWAAKIRLENAALYWAQRCSPESRNACMIALR